MAAVQPSNLLYTSLLSMEFTSPICYPGPLLELPNVNYPRKIFFPAGHHSIVLVRTRTGLKWTLIEDASIPYINTPLLRLILDCDESDKGCVEIHAPEDLDIPIALCYRYIVFEERIARYVRSATYNRCVVATLTEHLEETRRHIEALISKKI